MSTDSSSTSAQTGTPALGEQIARMARLIASYKSNPSRSPHGLEWPTYMLLLNLVRHGPQRSKSLADLMHSDPSTVSRQASALVDLGLVERGTDPDDRRAVQLVASQAGHELLDSVRAQRAQMFAEVLADWSAHESETFTALLARFNDDFERHLAGPPAPPPPRPTDQTSTPTPQETP
ncbi:MAG TPA: MarR family transcriptional regulator [Actinomycetales bacterium]|jgi:DNA-binding MarR family transcriptional regulator